MLTRKEAANLLGMNDTEFGLRLCGSALSQADPGRIQCSRYSRVAQDAAAPRGYEIML
jgi:hypothetical protein